MGVSVSGEGAEIENRVQCPPAGEDTESPERSRLAAERTAIEGTLSQWAAAILAADGEGLGSLVTEDAEFWSHGAAPLVGREALESAFQPFFASYELQQDFECQELIVAAEWAFMRGIEVNRMVPREGGDATVLRQRAFSVLKRRSDGVWLFARGMTNLPPEE